VIAFRLSLSLAHLLSHFPAHALSHCFPFIGHNEHLMRAYLMFLGLSLTLFHIPAVSP
jgi:hypothetical protein